MASPADEIQEPKYQTYQHYQNHLDRSSDEDGTVVGEGYRPDDVNASRNNLTLNTSKNAPTDEDGLRSMKSPSRTREQAHRLDDDLRMLQIERQVSALAEEEQSDTDDSQKSMKRERSRRQEVVDEFDVATNPLHERAQVYKPPEHPDNNFAKFMKRIHNSSFLVRYFTYIVPVVLIILIPLLIGALWPAVRAKRPSVGGVALVWFCVWLEVIWLTLWAGRVSNPSNDFRRNDFVLLASFEYDVVGVRHYQYLPPKQGCQVRTACNFTITCAPSHFRVSGVLVQDHGAGIMFNDTSRETPFLHDTILILLAPY